MDIRKFFGAPKAGAAKKPSENKTPEVSKKEQEKLKSKLSNFKREEKEKPAKDKNSTRHSKSSKTYDPKIKAKTNGAKDEEIVIDESSDEEVIPCSLDVKRKSQNQPKNSAPDSKKSSESTKQNKSKPKDVPLEKKGASDTNNKKTHNDKKDTSSSKKSNGESEKKKKKVVISESEDNNEEPVVTEANNNKNRKEKPSKKFTKRIQISEDESEGEVSIIKASSSDDEEIAVSSKKRKSRKRVRTKANTLLDSDSDEEDPVPQKKSQSKRSKKSTLSFVNDSDEEQVETAMDKFVAKKSAPLKVEKPKKVTPKKTNVNISDFFGSGSVSASRVERPAEKRKREEEPSTKKPVDIEFEEELHDDDDFLQVLAELDGPDVKKVKISEPEKEPVSEKSTKRGSLASKLVSKMMDTPIDSGNDINKNRISLSPDKKQFPSPKKSSESPKQTIKVTQRKTYTLELDKKTSKVPSEEKTEEERTPQKQKTPPKPTSSSKKDTDKEDDGFGNRRSSGFRAFKMRGGPQALGSKEIPEGAENCLEGLTFVITGVLDSIERDDAKTVIEKHGGRVTGSISKKTSYVVVGREAGESKLNKANELKVKQIDEDGLFELLKTLPGKTSKYEVQAKEQLKKEESLKAESAKSESLKKLDTFRADTKTKSPSSKFTQLKSSDEKSSSQADTKINELEDKVITAPTLKAESLMWVDKHKPSSIKQIIGQQGDKSNAHKLLHWIKNWHHNVIVKGLKASANFFGKTGGDGAGFRCALLSGPPGIGKTTTATLVCKDAGFSYVELNASDTRSKKNLKDVVAESLNNQTLVDFMGEDKREGNRQHSQHHCLIMDEVDGMAGNEDRGGLQELVQLVKNTKIPIICICNDRNSIKMRTLANYCFDLRFQRPRVEQIKGAMMTLAFREGLKIPPAALQEIIQASNHDIRQVIHNLSMWSASDKTLTFEQVKADAQKAQKDLKLGPFDVCRKVFVSDEETRKMSIHDKSDLFFHDYSFAPLFIHENYPHVIPSRAQGNKCKHMACLSRTMDSLCDGDLVEKLIRKEGNWNLLPSQAMYSSVIPGEIMRGSFPQMTNFPSWLGKNSSTGKTDRILQELGTHMALKISCDKRGLNQDYLPALRVSLTAPLASMGSDGVPGVIQMMEDYDIIKDDFDNILEVSKLPNSIDYMARVESKTKAALTRMYNKLGHKTPYASGAVGGKKKKGKASGAGDDADLLKEEGEEDDTVVPSEGEEEDEPAVVAKPKAKPTKGKKEPAKGKGGGGKKKK